MYTHTHTHNIHIYMNTESCVTVVKINSELASVLIVKGQKEINEKLQKNF